jgi:DNA polymerase III subunit epsilon
MEQPRDNLYSKTQLRKQGLIPIGEPVKRVKGEWGWFNLYNPDETKPVKKATATQLAALEKARAAKVQKEAERREEERQQEIAEWEAWEAEHRQDRNAAILWARRRLEHPTEFVILDVETTGLDSDDEVCSIGILRGDGETMLNCLVKPSKVIPEETIAIHGITNEAVAHAPSFVKVWPSVLEAIGNRELVIYNWSFDISMMETSLRMGGLEQTLTEVKDVRVDTESVLEVYKRKRYFLNGRRVFCAMKFYAQYVNEWSDYYGNYQWQPLCGNHEALDDCNEVLRLIHRMAEASLDA